MWETQGRSQETAVLMTQASLGGSTTGSLKALKLKQNRDRAGSEARFNATSMS